MKKALSLLLALALLVSLAGCRLELILSPETTPSTQATLTEETTSLLPDGPVILTTEEDPEKAEQDRLDAEQDLWEAQQSQQGSTQTWQDGYVADDDDRPRDDAVTQQTQPDDEQSGNVQTDVPEATSAPETQPAQDTPYLDPNGTYTSKDEVALYIHLYGKLPSNYITKTQAKSLYGSTSAIPKTMNIGGDRFYNREGLLPSGRTYYECDIGTAGGSSRGAKRIVFSSTGWIYYTSDHYASFTLLYEGS